MIHPLNQAEAERAFDETDRKIAKQRKRQPNADKIAVALQNECQKYRRNMTACRVFLREFDSPSGLPKDLATREIYAERAQLNAAKIETLQDQLRKALEQ